MVSWDGFERAAPDMAAAGRSLWAQHVLMYLGTVRKDGSPRVHPVVPVLAGGEIFVAVGGWSPKWRDLERDPRCVLHALPGPNDDEFVMRCRAAPADEAIRLVRAAASHAIHGGDRLFSFGIDQVDHGWWERVGQPGTFPVRRRWKPGTGVVELTARRQPTDEGRP
jgi:hypothetical protein